MNIIDNKLIYRSLELEAEVKLWNEVRVFLEEFFIDLEIDKKCIGNFIIACEEIYVNISKYAYILEKGKVTVRCVYDPQIKKVFVEFTDSGIEFDPTKKESTNIKQKGIDRPVGGLGILMAKKLCDSMEYKRMNNKNILLMSKYLKKGES